MNENCIFLKKNYLMKYLVNNEDGYKYSCGSNKKIKIKCPDCGFEKEIIIDNFCKRKFNCPSCGDGISYPEKVICNIIKLLNTDCFKCQVSKDTLKWCDKYRYDFYFELNNIKYIIESHGLQHYKETSGSWLTNLEQQQYNDNLKYNLAIQNGIEPENYIIIDCRYSDIDFIKKSILNSKLNDIFDLSNVNWNEIDKLSQKSLLKEVCDYWHLHREINNEDITTKDLEYIFKLDKTTIIKYLHKGNKINICNYNGKEEISKNYIRMRNNYGKKVEVFKNNKSLGIFKSCMDLQRQSEELFDVTLIASKISSVARGERKQYKGYVFKYI